MPDDDPIKDARERQHERAEHVENILDAAETDFDELSYPVRVEELAERYGSEPVDLPNETESLGDAFDRLALDREFDDPAEIREALYNELTGEEGDASEYNDERPIDPLVEDEGRDPRE